MPDFDITTASLAILALPLAAFVVQFFGGRWLPTRSGIVPTLTMVVACVASGALFATRVLGSGGPLGAHVFSRPWISIGPVVAPFSVLVDGLTLTMLFMVTTVSALVHVYALTYMRTHDGRPEPRYGRFFAYLSFFTFSMLLLVLAGNLLLLYVAWELVGVSSYLLIGFHLERPAAARASMKAFIVNRVGDAGFFAGILVVFATLAPRLSEGQSPFDFGTIFQSVNMGQWDPHTLTIAAVLLFIGAAAKSAQFPLHVWLPDAMEGPTPVSALIHAATMVAAGVYMVGRLYPIFAGEDALASHALWLVAGVGAATALLGATIALVQTDLKRGLAYSTVSQLGLMMLGLGVGGWAPALFHLFTHAFFKACLFLCAGAVIHAVGTSEMALMGGLRRKMPITHAAFFMSAGALAASPLLSGFWSKEAILRAAWVFSAAHGGGLSALPFTVAALTSLLTAFYIVRLLSLTFYGRPRDQARFDGAHECPAPMKVPIIILALLAIGAGGFSPGASSWFESRFSERAIAAGVIVGNSRGELDEPSGDSPEQMVDAVAGRTRSPR